MNRRSFVASLAALFAWMLPKPPRKRFVQRTFPNPVNPEYAKADEWLQEEMKRRIAIDGAWWSEENKPASLQPVFPIIRAPREGSKFAFARPEFLVSR